MSSEIMETGKKPSKRPNLPLLEIEKLVADIDQGKAPHELALKYGVKVQCIYNYKRKLKETKNKLKDIRHVGNRKSFKQPKFPLVDHALRIWFLQFRRLHIPLTMTLLQEKSKFFHAKLYHESGFKGSRGYASNFLERNYFRRRKISGEKASSDIEAALAFKKKFREFILEHQLQECQIWNADETGLFFKQHTSYTYSEENDKCPAGRKGNKERVTFMPTINMDGSFKMPLFVIGKSTSPRAFKKVTTIPVDYRASQNAWMTLELFKDYFYNIFVPRVRMFLREKGLPEKAVLFVDNFSGHGKEEELRSDEIWVEFLPPNTTSIIQPLDQHLIKKIKTAYRGKLLAMTTDDHENFETNLKKIDLLSVVQMLHESWETVTSENIQKCWKPLYDPNEDLSAPSTLERMNERYKRAKEAGIHEKEDIFTDAEIIQYVLKAADSKSELSDEEDFTGFDDTENIAIPDFSNEVQSENVLKSIDNVIEYMKKANFSVDEIQNQIKLREKILSQTQE